MITHVAIKPRLGDVIFSLPKPFRHHDVIQRYSPPKPFTQGFLNDRNTFLDREDAMQDALDCGQVHDGHTIHPENLFSEDLW